MRCLLFSVLLVSASVVAQPLPQNPRPGPVPDEAAAISIAIAVLKPIYGSEKIDLERPFVATLEGAQWHVQGSLSPEKLGGVAEVWIVKQDGRIVKVTHGR